MISDSKFGDLIITIVLKLSYKIGSNCLKSLTASALDTDTGGQTQQIHRNNHAYVHERMWYLPRFIATLSNHSNIEPSLQFTDVAVLRIFAESSQANATLLLESEEVRQGISELNHKVSHGTLTQDGWRICLIPAVLVPPSLLTGRSHLILSSASFAGLGVNLEGW